MDVDRLIKLNKYFSWARALTFVGFPITTLWMLCLVYEKHGMSHAVWAVIIIVFAYRFGVSPLFAIVATILSLYFKVVGIWFPIMTYIFAVILLYLDIHNDNILRMEQGCNKDGSCDNNSNKRRNKMRWFKRAKDKNNALKAIAYAIMDTSYQLGQEIEKIINNKYGKGSTESLQRALMVQYEILFFFCHITMRFSFAILGEAKLLKLQQLLIPLLLDSTTEAWRKNSNKDMKQRIAEEFYHNLNAAEVEYSKYKKIVPEKDEGAKDTLFWELSKNVTELAGDKNDTELQFSCYLFSTECFKNMNLIAYIEDVNRELSA